MSFPQLVSRRLVTWTKNEAGPLGLQLRNIGKKTVVASVCAEGAESGVVAGMILSSVAGKDVSTSPLQEIMRCIEQSTRPVTLEFMPDPDGACTSQDAKKTGWGFGQFASTTQFYLYGKRYCTQTGYQNAVANYEEPGLLDSIDLHGKRYMVTGANSGIGYELSKFLVSRGAKVFMVCRNPERAEDARQNILADTGANDQQAVVLLADCGLDASVRAMWSEFLALGNTQLDGLVCNAGALLSEKTLTSEGIEVTFASHLLFGTYLLGTLARSTLEATPGSRLVVVSSGGMYNAPFPAWEVATAQEGDYDGQMAYCYAKRGQVLLCERWAKEFDGVSVVSCHPGWTATPGVSAAYGDSQKYLEPLRTLWEGAEGIAWLCVVDSKKIEPGAFYLDRSPCRKHIAGPLFTEGSYTKNTTEQVDDMMTKLELWSTRKPSLQEQSEAMARRRPLQASSTPMDLKRFMGRWYVVAAIPTYFDRGATDCIEEYTQDADGNVQIDFTYQVPGRKNKSRFEQRAIMANATNTEWNLSPKLGVYLPVNIKYLVVDCAEDYTTTIIGGPDRSFLYIMARTSVIDDDALEAAFDKASRVGYDTSSILRVEHTAK